MWFEGKGIEMRYMFISFKSAILLICIGFTFLGGVGILGEEKAESLLNASVDVDHPNKSSIKCLLLHLGSVCYQ